MNKNVYELGEGKIGKLIAKYSLPMMLGSIAFALQNTIDRIFIGRGIGSEALSAVSLLIPLSIIISAFTVLLGNGCGALISIKLGENNKEEAEKILGNTMTAILVTSSAVMFLLLFNINPLLLSLGASEITFAYAKEYLLILLPGIACMLIFMSLQKPIISSGSPKFIFLTIITCTSLNIILDAVFIFKLKMGVRGAALATTTASFITAILMVGYFFMQKKSVLKLRLKNLKLEKKIIFPVLTIGFAPFSWHIGIAIVFGIMLKLLAQYGGDAAVGAMGVINSVSIFIIILISGLNMGAQPIIGYNYGAKKYERVKETVMWSMVVVIGITSVTCLMVLFIPRTLLSFFTKDEELIRIGIEGMRIYLSLIVLVGIQIVGADFFQAIGKPKIALLLSVLRRLILFLPFLYILPPILHVTGIWIAAPIADFLATIITLLFLYRECKAYDISSPVLNPVTFQEAVIE